MSYKKTLQKKYLILFISILSIQLFSQKSVRYDLTIKDTITNYAGKSKKAFAVNGQIPMPTLTFIEGDTAVIYIHNKLKNKTTSLHWHGLILPNQFDGVDYLTSAPIKAGETVIYKFPVIQNGTYWYHSHTGLQEQDGMHGAFIINKREKSTIPEKTILLSDWTNANSNDIMRRLFFEEEWFSVQKHRIQKGVTQSYWEALKAGYLGTKLKNEWKRMEAMDVSDIYYDEILVNGKTFDDFSELKAGEKIKLRIINGGSSSYFWVNYSGGKMEVIAADGTDVQSVSVDRLIMGVGETYDVIVTIPENNTSYELLATIEDRTRSTSVWLGSGTRKPATPLPPLKYFEGMKMMNDMMKMDGNLVNNSGMNMSMQTMDMNQVMFPEIIGEPKKERNSNSHKMNHSQHNNMQEMNHSSHKEMNHNKMNHSNHQDNKKNQNDIEVDNIYDYQDYYDKNKKQDHTQHNQNNQHSDHSMNQENQNNHNKHSEHSEHNNYNSDHDDYNNKNSHNEHSNNSEIITLNYGMLKSVVPTTLPNGNLKDLNFELTGNMNRYVWSINNKTISETNKILIKKGEILRITLYNNTMMRHPMHLHGHFFRILNGQNEYSPLKHTMDIMPMETNVIEFEANQDGDWIFHCHILYHMMAGMGRVFSYEDSPKNPQLHDSKMDWKMFSMMDKMTRFTIDNEVSTRGNIGKAFFENKRWSAQAEWKLGYKSDPGYEVETRFGRYIGKMQWLFPYVGYNWSYNTGEKEKNIFGQKYNHDTQNRVTFGARYLLPMRVIIDANIDTNGQINIELEKEGIVVSPHLRMDLALNNHLDFTTRLRYILTKYISILGYYDSEFKWGAGLRFRY